MASTTSMARVLAQHDLVCHILSHANNGQTLCRAACVSAVWRSAAAEDEVWEPVTRRCLWRAGTELLDGSADGWRVKHRLILSGACRHCVGTHLPSQHTPTDTIVCAESSFLACGRCRPNPRCASRCVGCGGDRSCPVCEDTHPMPPGRLLCADCAPLCGSCGRRVCERHMHRAAAGAGYDSDLHAESAGLCSDCMDAEYGAFDEGRRNAWHSHEFTGDGPWHVF